MFNWEKLKDMGINKAHKEHLVYLSKDGIHCNECGEHLSDHGERKGEVWHPMDIANFLNTDKE